MREITDGMSLTILLVEAHRDRAVVWTKPEDLPIDFKDPHRGLKGQPSGGFKAVICDGAVRFIPEEVAAETLRALFTKAGGEQVSF